MTHNDRDVASAGEDGLRAAHGRAIDPETPGAELDNLSMHPTTFVRVGVAKNPNTWDATLEHLLNDKELDVIIAVACHPKLSILSVNELSHHQEADVRASASLNPQMPESTLAMLVFDPEPEVRRHALAHPNTPGDLLRERLKGASIDEQRAIASNPSLSENLAIALYTHTDWKVRASLAANPGDNIPFAVREELSKDPYTIVRQRLASNPSLPSVLRSVLMSDPDDEVAYAAQQLSESVITRVVSGYQQMVH